MRRVLIPVDGSKRSEKSVELLKVLFKPGEVSVKLILVREDQLYNTELSGYVLKPEEGGAGKHIRKMAEEISDYNPDVSVVFGRAGEEILKCANQESIDLIIMTKSTKKGWIQTIGSVTAQVVKYAPCMVLIAPE